MGKRKITHYEEIEDKYGTSNSVFQSVWMVSMTVFTVGYGDVSPQTSVGKYLMIFAAFWGAFLISINVVTVTNML